MTYLETLKKSIPLLTAVPFFGLATGALFPLLALRLQDLGSDPAFIGNITAIYYCGSFIGAISFGAIASRVGYRFGFTISAFFAAIATFALTLTDNTLLWILFRFIGGYALGAYYTVVDSWFQGLAKRNTRGKLFATYETIRLGPTAAGPFLIVLGTIQYSLLIVGAAYLIAILPALLAPQPDSRLEKSYQFRGMIEITQCFPAALILSICGGVANASFYGLSAIYAYEIGFDSTSIAVFVALVLIAPACSQLPLGALADRSKRMSVAASCSVAAMLACLVLINIGSPPLWLACLSGAVVGGVMVPMYAFGISRMVDALGENEALQATSVGLIAYNIGAFCGPAAAGFVITAIGASGLYIFLFGISIVAFVAAVSDSMFSRCCPEHSAM